MPSILCRTPFLLTFDAPGDLSTHRNIKYYLFPLGFYAGPPFFFTFHGNLSLLSSRGLMAEAAEAPLSDVPMLYTREVVASDAAATAHRAPPLELCSRSMTQWL